MTNLELQNACANLFQHINFVAYDSTYRLQRLMNPCIKATSGGLLSMSTALISILGRVCFNVT